MRLDGEEVPVFPTDARERVWRGLVGTTPLDPTGEKRITVEARAICYLVSLAAR